MDVRHQIMIIYPAVAAKHACTSKEQGWPHVCSLNLLIVTVKPYSNYWPQQYQLLSTLATMCTHLLALKALSHPDSLPMPCLIVCAISCRLYLKRAQILDVRTPTTCDIHVSESRETIAGVSHNSLETAVPHAAMSRVLLLQGPHARQQAKLLERSADGAVTVQLLSDFSVVIVGLDDVAEYVGPEGEDE